MTDELSTGARREQRYSGGPVVVIQADDDPGDMGEPREWTEDGVEYLVVPSWELWDTARADERRRVEALRLLEAIPHDDATCSEDWTARGRHAPDCFWDQLRGVVDFDALLSDAPDPQDERRRVEALDVERLAQATFWVVQTQFDSADAQQLRIDNARSIADEYVLLADAPPDPQ